MSGSRRSRMPLPPLPSSIAGWRTTTPCIPIPGWAIAHPGSTSFPNPLRVRFDGVNSMAELTRAPQTRVDQLAGAFVLLRVIYTALYVADQATLRSIIWSLGLITVLWLLLF